MADFNDKKVLRRYFTKLRKSVANKEADSRIISKLRKSDRLRNADTVLLYAPFGSEPILWDIIPYLVTNGISYAFPKCGKNSSMTFHCATPDELHKGRYGIYEPDGSIETIPKFSDKTVCIVPGLAFTEKGERLGYGGGYYDRFLSKHLEIYTIALAYDKCIADSLPTDDHDIKVKEIITEERMAICNE